MQHPGVGGTSQRFGGDVQPASRNPYPISDQICDFPYPISDLTQNLIPYFRSTLTLFRLHKHLRRASNSQHQSNLSS